MIPSANVARLYCLILIDVLLQVDVIVVINVVENVTPTVAFVTKLYVVTLFRVLTALVTFVQHVNKMRCFHVLVVSRHFVLIVMGLPTFVTNVMVLFARTVVPYTIVLDAVKQNVNVVMNSHRYPFTHAQLELVGRHTVRDVNQINYGYVSPPSA